MRHHPFRDENFWIEEDLTEDGITARLGYEGVPRKDIVLAFHKPEMRQYTRFSMA
ncbi:MAG: element excision factor XisI family protein [Cyanobacteria bacterium P01_D01_bin.128]